MELEGVLFTYNSVNSIALKTKIKSNKTIVFIAGLTDNILTVPYLTLLNNYCQSNNICLVIPQLRSQPHFKIHSIDEDVEDIENVLKHIDGEVILFGHSTGCQDSLLFHKKNPNHPKVKGIILQAPVSDIEAMDYPNRKEKIAEAKTAGKYFEYDGSPWLTERFLTLLEERNKEDLFSSYLEDDAFAKFKGIPILSVLSAKDEYCNKNLSEKFKLMGKVHRLENGCHKIVNKAAQEELIQQVDIFLKETKFV